MSTDYRSLRQRRATVARRLLAGAPQAADALEWADLDMAPDWLAADDASLSAFCRQVGALACAPVIRLWIDKPRIAAAREAVGAAFLQQVLASHEAQGPLAGEPLEAPLLNRADGVAPALAANGCAVLLATLPDGPLRQAMEHLWSPVPPAALAPVLAQMMVERTLVLAADAAAPSPTTAEVSP